MISVHKNRLKIAKNKQLKRLSTFIYIYTHTHICKFLRYELIVVEREKKTFAVDANNTGLLDWTSFGRFADANRRTVL